MGLTRTRFVTTRLVLSSEETSDAPLALAFRELCKRIRSPAWKPSLLVVLGHDPEKRRDELERTIREDEAAEALDGELRAFFDLVLAPVMQERESVLVNTIHECVQQEMQAQQLIIQNQQQRLTQLTQEVEQWEKQAAHLKAKVDRRVAENNALRKEQYRQLLMLRDIMSKQGTEPGALSALNEAIAGVLAGKQQTLAPETTQSNNDGDQGKAPGRGWTTLNSNAQVLHREKEKWEQRAREAAVECQELRDKIVRLTQENMTYQATCAESVPWFLKPESAVTERQRIADAVCSYHGKWEDVGDSLVELLNNDILWAAVEQSARRGGKRRTARGLEAALAQIDNWAQPASIEEEHASDKEQESTASLLGRRRSTFTDLGRPIPCRACNGVGYIHADLGDNSTNDSDSYLRKTLEQVLELKTHLEKANTKALTLEGQLQLAHMHSAQLQEEIQQAELIKTSAMDSCLQTDLDEEEGLDLDEIMRSAYGKDTIATDTLRAGPRQNRRNTQYEHLIVELKSSLADKDGGLAESRRALDVAQTRTVTLQRALQKEKDAHAQELAMLKTSLAFSLKTRNTKIEERQAAVKLLMKKFAKKTPHSQPAKLSSATTLPTMNESDHDEDSDSSQEDEGDTNDSAVLVETHQNEQSSEQHEVTRTEALVRRYAEDIIRVRKEYETQQELLQKAETEMVEEDEKRSRTNSISQGSLVVSLASHPRDLFKALSTTQTDLLKLRRASQRSSALQTDRLLTLTTHLGHMSEELCTLRKRNLAELEFWKLECEKLQNTNKALEAEQQIYQKQLSEARDEEFGDASSGVCFMCEKHKKRLVQISKELLNQAQASGVEPEVEVPAQSALTEAERKLVSSVLMDLESIYSGMTAAKQKVTREVVATHLGNALNVSPRSARRTTVASPRSDSKDARPNNQSSGGGSPLPTRTAASSPRKSFAGIKSSGSTRQLKRTGETLNGKAKASPSPTRAIQEYSTPADPELAANATTDSETVKEIVSPHHRKTLVQEILEGGGFLLTKHGLALDGQKLPDAPEIEPRLEKQTDSEPDNNADPSTPQRARSAPLHRNEYESQNSDHEDTFTLREEQFPQFPLLGGSNDIERDPEVIRQLRLLVKQSSAAKERLSVSGWEILVLRMQCVAGEQRLDQLKHTADMRANIYPDGTRRPTGYKIVSTCATMAKIVQQRKSALSEANSAREISRRDLKNAQALLIHGVAMLLDNLSRKGKPTIELTELLYPAQGGSPRRSPTSNRLLYPATKVHLNHLPQTQQIPTTTFPALVGSAPDQPARSMMRSEEKAAEGSSYNEGYHLPHRLIKSAGPRPFHLVHSSIGSLQGSMPFPDPTYLRSIHESRNAGSAATSTVSEHYTPVRPRSSPAGPRLMSPRNHDFAPSATLTETPYN
ncbi:uncharacterized protein KRP23_7719 [Phytophthora ramorum]|uniref:uncharacterized protein n=1 Tax=Phytophthora ramorum TaxID=164328 RepID=UPI0030AA5785|nr:hypothetical protein KRP23_7719 [Phytophthora ramorum]